MSNQINLDTFKHELNAILDHDFSALTTINDNQAVTDVKSFLESHYAIHNEVRLGSIFNKFLDTNAFTDDKPYLMLHRIDHNGTQARVYIGSDAEIIGRFKLSGETTQEFTMGHEPDSQLYKVAVGISKQLGTDLSVGKYIHTIDDDRIAFKKEIVEDTFNEWLQTRLEAHADKFPNIAVADVMEVLDETGFWFEESMQDLIAQERFNKAGVKTPEALVAEIDNVGKAINEVVRVDGFEKVAVAFQVDVPELVNYQADELQGIYADELKSAFPAARKPAPKF